MARFLTTWMSWSQLEKKPLRKLKRWGLGRSGQSLSLLLLLDDVLMTKINNKRETEN